MIIHINALPALLRRVIHLVHYPDISAMRLSDGIPPGPAFTMGGTVGKGVDVLHGSEVQDYHALVVCFSGADFLP